MSARRALLTTLALASLAACSARVPPPRLPPPRDSAPHDGDVASCMDAPVSVAIDAGPPDTGPRGTPGFTLDVEDPVLVVDRLSHTVLRAHVVRTGGLEAPVLVELWGLPDGVFAQAREDRPGDLVTEVTIEASEDATPVERTPFAVQASALGLRQTYRVTLTVR